MPSNIQKPLYCTVEPWEHTKITMDCIFLLQGNENETFDYCSFIVEALTFLVSVFSLVVSVIAISFVKREYNLHKQAEMANTLSRYNERYCADEHIERTVNFLSKYHDAKNAEKHKYYSRKEILSIVKRWDSSSSMDKEIFLRFFEELQYSITQRALDKDVVYDMFSYYAIVAYELGNDFVEDFNDRCWQTFRVFAKSMIQIRKKKE